MRVPLVHLPIKENSKITKNNEDGRAYPLNDIKVDRKIFDVQSKKDRIKLIYGIVNYLDVESSFRYLPSDNKTFCNIYAYDIAYLLGAYLPRVWWKNDFIPIVKLHPDIKPKYSINVEELNVIMIRKWLNEFGGDYKWKKEKTFGRFKKRINAGTIGLICGSKKNIVNQNHICVALPMRIGFSCFDFFISKILLTEAGKENKEIYFKKWWSENDNLTDYWYLDIN